MKKLLVSVFALLGFSSAMAADSAAAAQQGGFGPIVFLVLIVAFMYFMVWRPQQKKAKAQRELVASVSLGDEVMTGSGIIGKVSKVYENYLDMEVNNGGSITIQRNAVGTVLPKGTIASIK